MFARVMANMLSDPRYLPARTIQAGWQLWCHARARSQPRPNGEVLCRALGKYDMLVSATDVGLAPFLIRSGSWELWIARFLRQRLRPGMVVMDAGANCGYFTLLMADAVGATGKVIAAEPIPATRSLLERNLALNGLAERTEVLGVALGAISGGEVTLIIPQGEPKNAIVQPDGLDYSFGRPYERVTAPAMRVDDLNLARLDLVKIDVEGQEAELWAGMQQTIARSPGIQIVLEVNGGRGPAGVAAFLEDIQRQFPLRAIDTVGNLQTMTVAQIIAVNDDVMLYLAKP
jgi:FkbM family methyltransferase